MNAASSTASDGIATVMFAGILSLAVPTIASINPGAAIVAIVAPTAWYLATQVFGPIQSSKPISRPDLNDLIDDQSIRFRMTYSGDTRALDIGLHKYIIFNKLDLEGRLRNWKALIGHEHAHLKNKDVLFFHFAGISALIVAASFFLLILLFLSVFWLSAEERVGFEANAERTSVLFALGLSAVMAFFILWIRRSLHRREFLADEAGYRRDPEAYRDWLRRVARRESEAGFSWSDTISWFTHPSFANRRSCLGGSKPVSGQSYVSVLGMSLGFLYGCAFLAYGVFVVGTDIGRNTGSANLLLAYRILVILIVSSGAAAISLSVMEFFESGGARKAAQYASLVVLTNLVLIGAFTETVKIFGLSQSLTQDLPDPSGPLRSGFLDFSIIFGCFGMTLFLLNGAVSVILRSAKFNLIAHLMIGALAIWISFTVPKLLIPMLI